MHSGSPTSCNTCNLASEAFSLKAALFSTGSSHNAGQTHNPHPNQQHATTDVHRSIGGRRDGVQHQHLGGARGDALLRGREVAPQQPAPCPVAQANICQAQLGARHRSPCPLRPPGYIEVHPRSAAFHNILTSPILVTCPQPRACVLATHARRSLGLSPRALVGVVWHSRWSVQLRDSPFKRVGFEMDRQRHPPPGWLPGFFLAARVLTTVVASSQEWACLHNNTHSTFSLLRVDVL
jgi:hypothetical protein